MLNSKRSIDIQKLVIPLILAGIFLLHSCMPTSTAPALRTGSTGLPENTTTSNNNYGEPAFPLEGTFIQESANQSRTSITFPFNFSDSFLIRGKALSQFLRTIPVTTKFCLVAKYSYTASNERFLLMAAKPRSFTDFINKTTEFYLAVEPSNDQANQNDCLSYNLTNTIFNGTINPSAFFSFTQLCQNCTTSVTSGGLRLYFYNGESVPNVTTDNLSISIAASTSSFTTSCSDSSACLARGFNCCLDSQCVNDKALRPGAMNLPGFLAAQEDVASNPDRYTVYPQYYFVCGSRVADTSGSVSTPTIDPNYEATIRVMELKQLYDCLNPVDGEFSYCSIKFPQANLNIPGVFSGASSGFRDDLNFSTLNPNLGFGDRKNNIVKIIYGGQTLYEEGKKALSGGTFVDGTLNDDLLTAQAVNITLPLPANARDANLYLTYKVDGTCERISATLAKCTKTYIQGSSETASTTWHDSSNFYLLPSYADVSESAGLIVKVSGIVVPEDASTWQRGQGPNRISFSASYPIYQNQKVEISYFVKTNVDKLLALRSAAQGQVNNICNCGGTTKCNLSPVLDSSNNVVNYQCSYPLATTATPPVNQTVYVSSKNTPHRYYDTNGVSYEDSNYGSAPDQELAAFSYTNNDVLRPNNVSQYIGFNEIYGSFGKTGTFVAKPAKTVIVKKDKLYDIIVNSGSFSSCNTCGTDYYSNLQRIFPTNFSGKAGGYKPDQYGFKRENSSSLYRSDDLLFGRACFVPATMIPWSHTSSSSVRDQRRSRLQAQHFLFANGYSRDWYGFDYGSLIGSFDGVNWFSVGNARKIKATTTKLFLAVNAYAGDLSIDNSFNVSVMESTAYSNDLADHDTKSDGAECQKYHYCSNDNDCFRQLGYDYSCQNISGLHTNWPQFDSGANELSGSTVRTLTSLVGGSAGQSRRCMYRGRGTPCHQNIDSASLSTATTFNGSQVAGTLACSPNNACVALAQNSKFNDRIARFAGTPIAQNASNAAPTRTDTVGLSARIILRPFDYYGNNSTPSGVLSNFSANAVTAMCIPGRDILSASSNLDLNKRSPTNRIESSDALYGVGPTAPLSSSPFAFNLRALNACPATDAIGINLQTSTDNFGTGDLHRFTTAQNMSTNSLAILETKGLQKLFSSANGSLVTSVGYQKNACLRAPGASCFSDLECSPSSLVATKARAGSLNILSGTSPSLSAAEVGFWSEELTCGNPDFRTVDDGALNPDFDLKKNKCCREFGKTFTVYTQIEGAASSATPEPLWCDVSSKQVLVPGVNLDINSKNRYSRVHTAYDQITCDRSDATKTFALSLDASDFPGVTTAKLQARYSQIQTQWKSLDTHNQRMCCTNHWVRSFHKDNGGGHAFAKSKLQNIDKTMFKHISWEEDKDSVISATRLSEFFTCEPSNYLNISCEVKNLTPLEETLYLDWAASLELVGIPQVAIKAPDQIYALVDDNQSKVSAGINVPLREANELTDAAGNKRNIMSPLTMPDKLNADFIDSLGNAYYSANNSTNLNMGTAATNNRMKKVFSDSEFNCCIPAGQRIPNTSTAGQCCTGYLANLNGPPRCCLPDYTDVTVYLNRYVSSEGRGLPDSAYDPNTGYIKDPGQVRQIATQKSLCCSGTMAVGNGVGQLSIPLPDNQYLPGVNTRRFTYRTDAVDDNSGTGNAAQSFDAGLRWNNHIYCVP